MDMNSAYKGHSISKLAEMALEKPEDFGWWGDEEMFVTWGWAGIDMHNASDAIEISNFQVITKILMETFPEDFNIVGIRHWAVGHADRLTVRVIKDGSKPVDEDNITDAFKSAIEWLDALDDYPIADENHFSELVYSQAFDDLMTVIPDFVLIKNNLEDTADLIMEELLNNYDRYGDIDVTDMSLSGYGFSEDLVVPAAYNIGLIDRNKVEEWEEAVLAFRLPAIDWDSIMIPSHVPMEGQMNLF